MMDIHLNINQTFVQTNFTLYGNQDSFNHIKVSGELNMTLETGTKNFSITAAIFTNSSGRSYKCIEVAIDHIVSNVYIYFMQLYAVKELNMTSIFINSTMDPKCTGYFSTFKQINSSTVVRIESVIIEGTYQVNDVTQNSLLFLYANNPKLVSMKRVSISPKVFITGPNSAFFITYYYNKKTEFTGGDIHGLDMSAFKEEAYSGRFLLIDCYVGYGRKGNL